MPAAKPRKPTVEDQCKLLIKNRGDLLESLASVGEDNLVELDGFEEKQDDTVSTGEKQSNYLRQIPRVGWCLEKFLETVAERYPNRRRTHFLLSEFVLPCELLFHRLRIDSCALCYVAPCRIRAFYALILS